MEKKEDRLFKEHFPTDKDVTLIRVTKTRLSEIRRHLLQIIKRTLKMKTPGKQRKRNRNKRSRDPSRAPDVGATAEDVGVSLPVHDGLFSVENAASSISNRSGAAPRLLPLPDTLFSSIHSRSLDRQKCKQA